jgi:hypothetical protein
MFYILKLQQLQKFQHVNIVYHICIYNRLPEDEPSGSKNVEDTKQLNIKILINESCLLFVNFL